MDNWSGRSYLPGAPHCAFEAGQCVKVRRSYKFAVDWPGRYVITSVTWEYQRDPRRFNIAIASPYDIANGNGSTDGFTEHDLEEE